MWHLSALLEPTLQKEAPHEPLKKIDADAPSLLKLRDEAGQAGHTIKRIAVAYEAAGDGFWLARWLRARDIEVYAIHPASVRCRVSTGVPRYFGYTIRRVPVDENFRAIVSAMSEAVSENTVMMLASMPSWSHGVCDPVRELAEIASQHGIWLHVDACVGGFLAPFVRELGRDVPDFDFRLSGVSSISADFHKYGYSGKGVSGVFYKNKVARHQPFIFDTWAAGLYRSPVLTGTRSGGAIASAWAVMRYLGRDGYLSRAAQILKLRDAILAFVAQCPGLKIVGGAELNVVGIRSEYSDIYSIASRMKEYGWKINILKEPEAIQFVLGPLRDEYITLLVNDLEKVVEVVRREGFRVPTPAVVYSDEFLD
ncbi:aminotransferase class V-fold PLP-dependent enzyme [Mesorhizobium sp. M3A.F.Ca.ET.080.04.2.1]|uniref:aminotransferase class V-fold PLP-dependent enzyme n=1 Tax=Mesorhizobium sp. M3A.F.Ca.ET.080.04.2.1 TaxID=2493676 RepID=UPI0013EC52BB|nr:aminotransferase class V-fold PLP-dependent enzyme [Mesorhizobium sp. M3A.F.Ca.ET.080.04.2.1]